MVSQAARKRAKDGESDDDGHGGQCVKMNKRNRPRDQIFNPILSILCAL